MRDYLINFNEAETRWHCVYFNFPNGSLNWNTAQDWQKDMRMTIRRDQQYFFTGIDANAAPISTEGGITRFQPISDQFTFNTWYAQNWNNDNKSIAYLRVRHHAGVTDTLEVQHTDGSYYFVED